MNTLIIEEMVANISSRFFVAVNHVNEISVKNRQAIDILIKEVERFKVE